MEIEFGGIQELDGAKAYLHPVIIKVGGWEYNTTVGFSYNIAKSGYGVLGQKGFFDIFKIIFDYQKETIELRPRHK